jgi:hypothetical protein
MTLSGLLLCLSSSVLRSGGVVHLHQASFRYASSSLVRGKAKGRSVGVVLVAKTLLQGQLGGLWAALAR